MNALGKIGMFLFLAAGAMALGYALAQTQSEES